MPESVSRSSSPMLAPSRDDPSYRGCATITNRAPRRSGGRDAGPGTQGVAVGWARHAGGGHAAAAAAVRTACREPAGDAGTRPGRTDRPASWRGGLTPLVVGLPPTAV